MPRPLVVVAAWEAELAALVGVFPVRGGPRFRHATVGVGLVEAASGTARLIASLRPRAVIMVGTAGVYAGAAKSIQVGQAAVIARMTLVSSAVTRGDAYFPDPLPLTIDSDRRLRKALLTTTHLPHLDVACPLGITRKLPEAATIERSSQAALENLEVFAVARACFAVGVPFAAVLGVANKVGPRAHVEWRQHGGRAAAVACTAVATWLDSV